MRQIALMDCNNFFVSCERLFRPDLVHKPVIVLSSNDGCVVARSQEVKAIGIPMGLPFFQVKQLVDTSQITFFSSNFTLYRDISARVMQTLRETVGTCEVYSVDEAFFELPLQAETSDLLAIREIVMQKTGIPVTIGLAPTKTLAKAASKLGKQSGGVYRLTLEAWQRLAETYPLEDVWNLGRSTARTLRAHGITSPALFMGLDAGWVGRQLGTNGRRLQDELRGTAIYPVGKREQSLPQSIASTRSFPASFDREALLSAVAWHVAEVSAKLRRAGLIASWMSVELRASRYSTFAYRRGSKLAFLPMPTNETTILLKTALRSAGELYEKEVPFKKAGVVLGGLVPETFIQPTLLLETVTQPRRGAVDSVVDSLNRRFGAGTIQPAVILDKRPKTTASMRSPRYTTAWKDIPTVRA